MSEFNRELFELKASLQVNACHLSDIRDAITILNREWDELQEYRTGLIKEIVAIERVQEHD